MSGKATFLLSAILAAIFCFSMGMRSERNRLQKIHDDIQTEYTAMKPAVLNLTSLLTESRSANEEYADEVERTVAIATQANKNFESMYQKMLEEREKREEFEKLLLEQRANYSKVYAIAKAYEKDLEDSNAKAREMRALIDKQNALIQRLLNR